MMFNKSPMTHLTYHLSMLTDHARVDAYRQAIFDTVRPGDIVLDIGTGTGILSLFACQAGARRVYAIEAGRIIEAARAVCKQNGFDDRVVFMQELSTKVELPERADVLITETIGNFGLEESILGYVRDARQRLLKDDARILPASLALHVVPLEAPQLHAAIESWNQPIAGLDFSSVRPLVVNNPHWVKLDAAWMLGQPAQLCKIELACVTSRDICASTTCTVTKYGTLHGLGGWFSADLDGAGTVVISNAPPTETSWSHAFLPFETPCDMEPGDTIEITLRTVADATVWQWRGTCRRRSAATGATSEVARFNQSSFLGQMMPVGWLRRLSETHCPQLTEQGCIDQFILQMIDGSSSLKEIAQRAAARFPGVFSDPGKALERARLVSQRYA